MDKRPIGMFDSGVGGLTVLKEVIKTNPNEDIVYLGDTKSFPYGNKSKENIIELTKKGIDFLISKNVKCIVIACGTATSQALEEVSKIYKVPIIGIIQPTVDYIKEHKNIRNIGVIATVGTIRSKGWENTIEAQITGARTQNKACPLLAPMAEEGWTDNEIAKLVIKEYLKDFKNIDSLILGCTHYPLFKNIIEKQLPKNVEIINTGEKTSKSLKKLLYINNIQNDEYNKGDYKIFLTDIETNFINVAEKLLKSTEVKNKVRKV